MTCRLITPDSGFHQSHMGQAIAEGAFADDGHPDVPDLDHTRICIHPDADGLSPVLAATIVAKHALLSATGTLPPEKPKRAKKAK